ncbi:apolipoprotein N-acyltransferase [Pseudodesulfovibrio cashew]|uniref:Apolipoprotein N-acyltransferase n=1 Tax=Pseudodesulfovibrio cashew TaxID=2678688 RepID=A0A6I6JE87_9BACT|nr:apolipoprotein N-acyltransferase [Pseudodesulfovibrio cashew]QGY41145.1 apolipoprotein N-acyltransferase [Pseudodesulfovibrio cashew]
MLTLVLIAAVGTWIGFANPLFHFPLAALALPLGLTWIGLRATSAGNAFKFAWIAGLLAGIGIFYWVVIPVQIYGGLPWYVALPCPALLAAALAVYYALFAVLMHVAGQRVTGIPLCLMAGLAWSTMELGMGTLLSGFPWMTLASAFTPWTFAIQGASLIGAYGLSGVLAALAVAILLYSTYRSTLWFAVCMAALITGFGVYRLQFMPQEDPSYMVSLVQGNIDQALKWEPKFQAATVKEYASLSLEAIDRNHPELVIWPETAMPFYLQDVSPFQKAVKLFAHDTHTPIVTGSPAYKVIDLKKRDYVLFNRAWLVDDLGNVTQSYDKEHLVPFGEYMPLEEYVPFKKLVQAAGDFKPGTDNKPLVIDSVALGMLICYEGIFPDLAQQQVERGATALLNISNDAWFGDTSAPKQHLDLTVLRAVEQGRWLVRCTNNGISAFVDPLGRLALVGGQFRAETLSAKIAPLKETTPYHRIHDDITFYTPLLTLALFAWVIIGVSRKTTTG